MAKTMNSKQIRAGDFVIVKRSGIMGRESEPIPVVEVTDTEIVLPHEQSFSRSSGERLKQKPESYSARILRIATPEDLATQLAKKGQAEENEKTTEARGPRMAEIAEWFPANMRPHVEAAWSGTGLRLEFDGLSESTVRSIADLMTKAPQE